MLTSGWTCSWSPEWREPRLAELGVRDEQAEILASSEPNLGDSWLAYLSLAPISVIDDLTK